MSGLSQAHFFLSLFLSVQGVHQMVGMVCLCLAVIQVL